MKRSWRSAKEGAWHAASLCMEEKGAGLWLCSCVCACELSSYAVHIRSTAGGCRNKTHFPTTAILGRWRMHFLYFHFALATVDDYSRVDRVRKRRVVFLSRIHMCDAV
jgi:hypothetical protein